MTKYNADKLIKVRVFDFSKSKYYLYKKEKKFLGIPITEEGFYSEFVVPTYVGKDIPEGHTFTDGVVYEKPKVRLYFQDDSIKNYIFDTYDEAKAYYDTFNSKNWIE